MNPLVTEARALCEAATFGPWKTHEKAGMSEVWDNDAWAKGFGPLALVGSQPEDAAFIARSRTLLPEMAAEIERLQAELDAANNLISRAAVWLDLHKAGGIDDVLREFAKHLAAMKEDAHG